MKKLLAAGAIVLTVAVAAAVFVIPAMAAPTRGAALHTNAHSAHATTKLPSMFALEHIRGVRKAGAAIPESGVFNFSCSSYGATHGNKIVFVTEKIANDADSGQAGDYWAFDTINRSIAIWNVGPDQYCVLVNYFQSTFQAIAGQQSPGSTTTPPSGGTLSGEEYGSFSGMAVFTITGQLDVSDPTAWPTTGKVNGGNVVDYQCDSSGNCPDYVSFTDKYFAAGYTYAEPQWGWRYVGKDSGTNPAAAAGIWVNALSGNSGDILDTDD